MKPTDDEAEEVRGITDRLRSVRETASRTADRVTGAEFRREIEEFTGVVSTTVLGVHKDQSEIIERIDKLEQEISSKGQSHSRLIAAVVISLSTAAMTVAVIAIVIAL